MIRPDGKVSLCGNDPYGRVTLGDASRQSLSEIWYGEAYRKLRAELTQNGRRNLEVCRTCDVHTFDPAHLLGDSGIARRLSRAIGLISDDWK